MRKRKWKTTILILFGVVLLYSMVYGGSTSLGYKPISQPVSNTFTSASNPASADPQALAPTLTPNPQPTDLTPTPNPQPLDPTPTPNPQPMDPTPTPVPEADRPGTPVLVSAKSAGCQKITLSWARTKNAEGYRVFRKMPSGWKRVGEVKGLSVTMGSTKSFPIVAGETYLYTVRAYRMIDGSRIWGGYDNLGIRGRALPLTPGLKSLATVKDGIRITWSKESGVDGYRIYRRGARQSWKSIALVKGSTSGSYVDTKAKANTIYAYTVKAYKLVKGKYVYGGYDKTGLRGKRKIIVAIDPGHQGPGVVDLSKTEPIGPGSATKKLCYTMGTQGRYTGLTEYQLTLDVSLKLKKLLEKKGYQVFMTRTDNQADLGNIARATKANNSGAAILVRIHANGDNSPYAQGAMTMCPSLSNPYVSSLSKDSYRLSEKIVNAYCAATGFYNRGVWYYDDMTGINWSKIPVTIIEMGFMTNYQDDTKMAVSSFQETMARGIANGIHDYFTLSK